MHTLKLKRVAFGLIAGLTLALPLYAQMGQMKAMPGKTGTMGSMKMTGTMNGKPCTMQCGMMPSGSPKGMMGKGMMGKGMMGGMKMTKPMKMTGTMTCMGQTYHCTMMMTPQGK